MITNELNSQQLKKQSDNDQWNALVDVWSEVKLLTGVILYPDDDPLLLLQLQVLKRFITSNPKFSSLTKTEILHAFYLNSQGELDQNYKHYNKELNAEFVGDVLGAYVKKKSKLYGSKLGEINKILNPPSQADIPKITDDMWKIYVQQDYWLYKAGMADMIYNVRPKYMMLRRVALIEFSSKERWHQWVNVGIQHRKSKMLRTAAETEGARITKGRMLSMYDLFQQSGVLPVQEYKSAVDDMRRLVYLKFFEVIASCAINNIFQEIEHRV